MELLIVGKIVDSFGLDGTSKVLSSTSFVDERFKIGNKILAINPKTNEEETLTVESVKKTNDLLLVKFSEISSKEESLAKKNYILKANKNNSLLEKDHYYYSDLCNCKIVNQKDIELGLVTDIEEFPAQVTLRVKRENKKDFFVPFVRDFIIKVDIENKIIKINEVEGLL